MVKRKRCNFQVPRPFVILSSNGLQKNGLRRYVIYQDLSLFRAACRRCKLRRVVDKRSSCAIGDPDFMLKYYGIVPESKGVRVSLGTVPQELLIHPLGREVESWLSASSKRIGGRSIRSKKQIV
jgi:hypothetical protein